jgi:hypothetical protein
MKKQKKRDGLNRWKRDPVKENYWRKQLALWQKSGLSIRAFCKEHGVVEASFYTWRRELIIRARESGTAEEITSVAQMTPNTLKDGRGREIAIRYRQTDQPAMEALLKDDGKPNPFVPIRIFQREEGPQASREIDPNNGSGRADVEIVLPGGAVIRLSESSNIRLVAELFEMDPAFWTRA